MSKHCQLTFKQHLQQRAFYGGSAVVSEHDIWVWDTNWVKETRLFSDALLDNIDEIRVNAMDHYYRSVDSNMPVTFIKFSFNETSGKITISNDGQGIPVIKEWKGKTGNGYLPQAIISEERSGSNFDDEKEPDRVTGGMNGLGMKITNVGSIEFTIETVDTIHRKIYLQTCRNKMNEILEPTITNTNIRTQPHTSISWIPDYDNLCRISKQEPSQNWFNNNKNTVKNIILMMCHQTAVFIASINYRHNAGTLINHARKAKIYFNDSEIKLSGIADFMKSFGLQKITTISFSGELMKFPWYVGIGLKSQLNMSRVKTRAHLEQMSLINGVHVGLGGSHVNLMVSIICASIKQHFDKEIPEAVFNKIFCYFDCKQFPFSAFDFDSQTKNKINIGRQNINALREQCVLTRNITAEIWNMAKDDIMWLINSKELNEQIQESRKNRNVPIRKYDKADKAGTKESYKCGCFVGEGDSACKTIRNIVKHKKTPIDKAYYGIYSIQGVPPNALKMVTPIKDPKTGKIHFMGSYQLRENIALKGLVRALGLDYGHSYELNTVGNAEFTKLNYGFMVMATDQDLDGIGHICSLAIVFIMTFWPNLVKRNFFRRFATPIIRVYSSKQVINFYSEKEYNEWVLINYGSPEHIPDSHRTEYYKGLGGHSKEEILDMGKNFHDNIFTMTYDDACEKIMSAMYGNEVGERKVILSTPMTHNYPDNIWVTQKISVSDHFRVESKEFQLYNMRRKLKSYIDGMIPTQRKAFCGGRKMFAKTNKAKVFQISGYIAKSMHYAHGDSSMNGVIMKMAQSYVGSNNIPAYVPISDGFGDRVNGRSANAGPRYVDTKYNSKIMNKIFPQQDDWLLDYNYEDGVRCEPKYYVPILPMSILESETTTGTGWKIDIWARHIDLVVSNTKALIHGSASQDMLGQVWFRSDKMKCRIIDNQEVCFGSYEYNASTNIITITELPIRIWSYPYCCHLLGVDPKTGKSERRNAEGKMEQLNKKPYIKKVKDDTNNYVNDIKIWLEPNGYEEILKNYGKENCDPVEHFLNLYRYMTPNLNMIDELNYVKEFADYNDILMSWFLIRRQTYITRIDRNILLHEIQLDYWKNILRFIKMDSEDVKEINIDSKFNDTERDEILEKANFKKFNKSIVLNPGFTKIDKLKSAVYSIGANYKYISDITIRDKSKESIKKLEEKIKSLEVLIEELATTTWQEIWIAEIDDAVDTINLGLKTDWLFQTKQNNFIRLKTK